MANAAIVSFTSISRKMIGIMIRDWRSRWLGIDFSGNHRKWGAGCASSNIWIADIRRDDGLALFDLCPFGKAG